MMKSAAPTSPISAAMPHVQCPVCRAGLEPSDQGVRCSGCGEVFGSTLQGQRDFRLRPEHRLQYTTAYAPLAYDETIDVALQTEQPCAEQRNHFRGTIPVHLTADQISYIPQAAPGATVLDLGCGHGIHRSVLEQLGYRYHGVDYAGAAADDLVDAHALPFRDETFDLVFSVAVLEHLAHPQLALAEVHRVLKPGKFFLGTVAFMEPFHDNSFFHFSHVGLCHALRTADFTVEAVMPVRGWHAVRAQLEMGFGARLPRSVSKLLTQPFVWALESHALAGRVLGRGSERHRRDVALARHAGAFYFVGRRSLPCRETGASRAHS